MKPSMCVVIINTVTRKAVAEFLPLRLCCLFQLLHLGGVGDIRKVINLLFFFFLGTNHGGDLENSAISNYDNISSLSRQYIFFSHTFIFCKLKQVKNKIVLTVKTP